MWEVFEGWKTEGLRFNSTTKDEIHLVELHWAEDVNPFRKKLVYIA